MDANGVGLGRGVGVAVGTGVGVGSGVGVTVGAGVAVAVGTDVGVAVGSGCAPPHPTMTISTSAEPMNFAILDMAIRLIIDQRK